MAPATWVPPISSAGTTLKATSYRTRDDCRPAPIPT